MKICHFLTNNLFFCCCFLLWQSVGEQTQNTQINRRTDRLQIYYNPRPPTRLKLTNTFASQWKKQVAKFKNPIAHTYLDQINFVQGHLCLFEHILYSIGRPYTHNSGVHPYDIVGHQSGKRGEVVLGACLLTGYDHHSGTIAYSLQMYADETIIVCYCTCTLHGTYVH